MGWRGRTDIHPFLKEMMDRADLPMFEIYLRIGSDLFMNTNNFL